MIDYCIKQPCLLQRALHTTWSRTFGRRRGNWSEAGDLSSRQPLQRWSLHIINNVFSGWTEKVKVRQWKWKSEKVQAKVKKWKWKGESGKVNMEKWKWKMKVKKVRVKSEKVKMWLWKGEHHILSASHAWDSSWPARVRSITQREPSFHLPRSFINLSGLSRIKFTHKSLICHFPSIDEVFHLQGGKFCSSTFQMTNFHPAAVKVKSKAHSRPS